MKTRWVIVLFVAVAVAVSVTVHFARWAEFPRDDSSVTTTQPTSQMIFWSIREFWESAGGLPTVLLSLCLTITATLLGVRGAKKTNAYLEENRRANRELNKASGLITQKVDDLSKATGDVGAATDRLLLHTQNEIRNFPSCKLKAEEMLVSVPKVKDSKVRLAVFWPMFGADLGEHFQSTGKARFDVKDDCLFYCTLYERIDGNFSTELLFLEYEGGDSAQSELANFIDALGSYRNASLGRQPNFSKTVAVTLKKAARQEITERLIPLAKARDKVRLMVVEDLPVLLLIVDHGASSTPPKREGLLLIGNCAMIESDLPVGGFYTQEPAMIDVLDGLFASLSKNSKVRLICPTAKAKS